MPERHPIPPAGSWGKQAPYAGDVIVEWEGAPGIKPLRTWKQRVTDEHGRALVPVPQMSASFHHGPLLTVLVTDFSDETGAHLTTPASHRAGEEVWLSEWAFLFRTGIYPAGAVNADA